MCLSKLLNKKMDVKEGWKLFEVDKYGALYGYYSNKINGSGGDMLENKRYMEEKWLNEKDYRKSHSLTESIFGVPKLRTEVRYGIGKSYPTGFHVYVDKPKISKEYLELWSGGTLRKVSIKNIRAYGNEGWYGLDDIVVCEEIFIHKEGYDIKKDTFEKYLKIHPWKMEIQIVIWDDISKIEM